MAEKESDEDYSLVIAGARAGKTTTVAAKVKYLVEKPCLPCPIADSRYSPLSFPPNAPHRSAPYPFGGICRCHCQKSTGAWRHWKIPGVSSPPRCHGVFAPCRRLPAFPGACAGSHILWGGGHVRKGFSPR